jgi:hypothetical protein
MSTPNTSAPAEVEATQGRVRVYMPGFDGTLGWQESTFSTAVDGAVEQKTFTAVLPDGTKRQVVITVDVLQSDEPVTPGPVYPEYPNDEETEPTT